jgi:predicted ATPase
MTYSLKAYLYHLYGRIFTVTQSAQGEGQSKNTQRKTVKGQGVLLSDAEDMLPDILPVGVFRVKNDKTTLAGGGVGVTLAVLCWKREERSLKNNDAAAMGELYTPAWEKSGPPLGLVQVFVIE